jgi:hypothetical protein
MARAMYFGQRHSAPFDHASTMTTTALKPTSRGRVDASVMPSIIRDNTNAAVIAMAEKAADKLAFLSHRRQG